MSSSSFLDEVWMQVDQLSKSLDRLVVTQPDDARKQLKSEWRGMVECFLFVKARVNPDQWRRITNQKRVEEILADLATYGYRIDLQDPDCQPFFRQWQTAVREITGDAIDPQDCAQAFEKRGIKIVTVAGFGEVIKGIAPTSGSGS